MRTPILIAVCLPWLIGASDPCRAQYMALTRPGAPAIAPAPDPSLRRWPAPPARPPDRSLAGTLPNQHTGSTRNRAIGDICIGCDR